MEEKNIHNPRLFNMNKVMWMLGEKKYYTKILAILKKKSMFNSLVWAYSMKHHDVETFKELC
jgi:hypothetical protein